MNDFLIGLAITVGGSMGLSAFDTNRAVGMQKASCASKGGTWKADQTSPQIGMCYQGATPVNSDYSMLGASVTFGLPIVAALLATRSITGALGTLLGAGGIFLGAISEIH